MRSRESLRATALVIGLRKGEALGLRWQDVDLEGGTLWVRTTLQRIKGGLTLTEPRTARSRRTIRLPKQTIVRLRLHRARQQQERLLASRHWQETGLVFTTTIGTPIDPRNALRPFKDALVRAGLATRRFHDSRHTCASLLLAQGIHPRVVMELLGHSTIAVTMDTYSHVMPELHTDAASKMDAVLSD